MNKVIYYTKILFSLSIFTICHWSEAQLLEKQNFTHPSASDKEIIQNILSKLDVEINVLHEQSNANLNQLSDVIKKQKDLLDKTGILMEGIYETFNKSRDIVEEIKLIEELIIEIEDQMTMMEQEISSKIERNMIAFKENLIKAFLSFQTPINCPVNSNRFGAECLEYVVGARDWHSWRKYCKDLGGDLASLGYPELPLELLMKVLPELTNDLHNVTEGMYATLFLGGRQDMTNRKTWRWLNGEQILINDSRWFKDQPDMTLELSQHCLGIRFLKTNSNRFELGFEDISCDFMTTAICEMPRNI